ncbi:MAG: RnfABCDGE type electron transport complex subunit D [Patescibacteria group bacterium]
MLTAFKVPKIQMVIALLAIFLASWLHAGEVKLWLLLSLSLVATISSDFLFLKLRGKPLFFPSAAIVSGIIIALLIPPNSHWYQILLPGLLAMWSKNFLRVSERHVFNPAAFGLLVSEIILKQNISWWGVSWQQLSIHPLAFIVLLTPFLISALRMRRYFIQLAFLLLLGLLKVSPLDPTLLFFASVMLPEPMTTPPKPITQLAFGLVASLLSMINYFPNPLLFALLISNVLFFKLR